MLCQEINADVVVVEGGYNLRVDELCCGMRPASNFQSAFLPDNSQSWSRRGPRKATVDGAIAHFSS